MSDPPLHALDPTGRFASRAGDYAKFRPDYPAAAIETVLEGFVSPVVADIGAGTGISTRLLAAAGARVIAIEPNAPMRASAERRADVEWIDATAEATSLQGGAVDVVACFQAFHWFDPDRALAEFHRILKPRGRVALVWNERDRADPFTAAYSEVIARFATSPPAEERKGVADPLLRSALFTDAESLTFKHWQALRSAGVVGRARSTSYLPAEGAEAEELWRTLREIHARFASSEGIVDLHYLTQLHRATRA